MRLLEAVTLVAVLLAGYFGVSPLIVLPASVALMLDNVLATAFRLRRAQGEPLSSKNTTYLVSGAVGWTLAAWAAYVIGAAVKGVL